MKKLIFAFVCSMATMAITAQVKMPAPSPTQTLKQDFALGSIEVKYALPPRAAKYLATLYLTINFGVPVPMPQP